ncbi:unnamed protein product [Brugia timori]|uniref:Uncharacterized protein n=1 Tax=Brugia timori TaxID=42155 RepID=A0A0R3R6D0_9BILA|nr:unnamed protein product [Brugia timori]
MRHLTTLISYPSNSGSMPIILLHPLLFFNSFFLF